ncbi:MAG: hypothetical protein ABJA90_11095 [Ginsengibacter sp.]
MKKIITLLFCSALLSSAFSQSNSHDEGRYNNDHRNDKERHDDWKYNKGDRHDDNRRDNWNRNENGNVYRDAKYYTAQRDQSVQRVSREYDYKIQAVSTDRYMNRREKKRAIKTLQAQKDQQIRRIYSEYNNRYVYSDSRHNDDRSNGRGNGYGHYKK